MGCSFLGERAFNHPTSRTHLSHGTRSKHTSGPTFISKQTKAPNSTFFFSFLFLVFFFLSSSSATRSPPCPTQSQIRAAQLLSSTAVSPTLANILPTSEPHPVPCPQPVPSLSPARPPGPSLRAQRTPRSPRRPDGRAAPRRSPSLSRGRRRAAVAPQPMGSARPALLRADWAAPPPAPLYQPSPPAAGPDRADGSRASAAPS